MADHDPNVLLHIRDLDIRFRIDRKHEPFRAVKGISFDIPRNSTVALVGESGSGKSVSAMSILGLLPENAIVAPTSQAIYYAAGAAMAVLVTAFSLLTDALRDALDPKLK